MSALTIKLPLIQSVAVAPVIVRECRLPTITDIQHTNRSAQTPKNHSAVADLPLKIEIVNISRMFVRY